MLDLSSKSPKRVEKYKMNIMSRKPRECLYANHDELDKRVWKESDNELGFIAMKEESPQK